MAFPIDPSKSAHENLLALVNHANSSDLTLTDVDVANIQALENAVEGSRNTSASLLPKPEGRFNVAAGGVTVNYRRLSFAELILNPVEIKAQRTTTLTEIHQAICNAYGLIQDGVVTDGVLPGPGTILPGETFEVTITPSELGGVVYFPKPQTITITWDGVWLEALLTNQALPGFKGVDTFVEVVFDTTTEGITQASLDAKVLSVLGNWSDDRSIKIRVMPGVRLIGTTDCFTFDAKYGNRPFILIENHGFIVGRAGLGGARGNYPGNPGNNAIVVARDIRHLLQIDNQGTLIGGGGGGGADGDYSGGWGAPYHSTGVTWDSPWGTEMGGSWCGGQGGRWGQPGDRSLRNRTPGGAAGQAVVIAGAQAGDTIGKWINKGTVYGVAAE